MPESNRVFGSAWIEPTADVVTGTYGTWKVGYEVGELGVDDGGTVLVAFSQTSDMGTPQFDEPTEDHYCSVTTNGPATVIGSYAPSGYVRPFKHAVEISVTDGSLAPGDRITLRLGDRSEGSRGIQAQTFVETDFRFRVLVDAHNTGDFEEASGELTFDLVAGKAVRLEAVVPSTVISGKQALLSVRAEDYWGNVATEYDGGLEYVIDNELSGSLKVEGGTGETTFTMDSTGIHRVTVAESDGMLTVTSNPMACREETTMHTYWGDIHGQSGETVGTGTVREYFEFGRNAAFVDFAAHAGNDFQITDKVWEEIKEAVRAYHEPGRYVTFHCYEWSANTSIGGDHNVYFRGDDPELNRSSKWLVDPNDRSAGTRPIQALYDLYQDREDVIIVPHQGGRPAALDVLNPDQTPFVEITSVWGVFESFGHEALELGHIGFVGGSDDHCGRPGTAPPDKLVKHNISGGLMAAKAPELSRDALWKSFKDRSVYATTGDRILLDMDICGSPMGTSLSVDGTITASIEAHGTAPIQEIELFRGSKRVDYRDLTSGDDCIEIRWSGAKGRVRDKLLNWSGGASIDRGCIEDVTAYGFDHPDQGIQYESPTDVTWVAYTSGNHSGVRITLDSPPDATLTVGTDIASATVSIEELGEKVVEANGDDAKLEIRRVGFSTKTDVAVELTDDVEPGTYPYYIRLRQADGEMAWSSPVMLTRE